MPAISYMLRRDEQRVRRRQYERGTDRGDRRPGQHAVGVLRSRRRDHARARHVDQIRKEGVGDRRSGHRHGHRSSRGHRVRASHGCVATRRPGVRVPVQPRGIYSPHSGRLFNAIGLLPRGNAHLIPYAMRLYEGLTEGKNSRYWAVCDRFRETFARPVTGAADRRFPVHFLGLWDTVSSVGWLWDPRTYAYTWRNAGVRTIRHAISLDERRCCLPTEPDRTCRPAGRDRAMVPGRAFRHRRRLPRGRRAGCGG